MGMFGVLQSIHFQLLQSRALSVELWVFPGVNPVRRGSCCLALGKAAVHGNGNEQKPGVFLQDVSHALLCRRLPGMAFVSGLGGFFEAEISVFLNVYFVPVLEDLGLNLDAFIIDSMG